MRFIIQILLSLSFVQTAFPQQHLERKRGARKYELNNHLGNVLATITDRKMPVDDDQNGSVDWYEADVYTAQDYYAAGMVMPGRVLESEYFRFGFQEQEGDREFKGPGNSWNYKYRMQDSRLGRFISIDPVAKDYSWYAPYQFAGNKLIAFIDLEGKQELDNLEFNKELINGTPLIQIQNKNDIIDRDSPGANDILNSKEKNISRRKRRKYISEGYRKGWEAVKIMKSEKLSRQEKKKLIKNLDLERLPSLKPGPVPQMETEDSIMPSDILEEGIKENLEFEKPDPKLLVKDISKIKSKEKTDKS